MADIYLREEEDIGYVENQLEIIDETDILLSQIEMLLYTEKNEVLGAHKMGIDLKSMLWTLNASQSIIKTSIYNQIYAFCPLAKTYKVDVDVKIFKGTTRDIGVIDILINGSRKTGYIIN